MNEKENEKPAAIRRHSLGVFGKQPKEKQEYDWSAALHNETDVCDGLNSNVEATIANDLFEDEVAPYITADNYQYLYNDLPALLEFNPVNEGERNNNENEEGWEARETRAHA
jgi:hypothetical protein